MRAESLAATIRYRVSESSPSHRVRLYSGVLPFGVFFFGGAAIEYSPRIRASAMMNYY